MLCELPPLTLLLQPAQETRSSNRAIPFVVPEVGAVRLTTKLPLILTSAGEPPLTSLARTIVTPPVVLPGHRTLMTPAAGGALRMPAWESSVPWALMEVPVTM